MQTIIESGASRLSGIEYGLSLQLFSGAAGRLKSEGTEGGLVPGMSEYDPALVSGRVRITSVAQSAHCRPTNRLKTHPRVKFGDVHNIVAA